MTYNDIYNLNFSEYGAADSFGNIVLTVALSCCIGLFIYLIYKKSTLDNLYSESFGITLILLPIITASVILVVKINPILALGIIGVFSIIRTSPTNREPMEIVFQIWSISVGIILASNMISLALILSVIIGLIILIFAYLNSKNPPYMLVLNCDNYDAEVNAMNYVEQCVTKKVVKSKTEVSGESEVKIEIRLKDDNTDFIWRLSDMPGVNSALIYSGYGDKAGQQIS